MQVHVHVYRSLNAVFGGEGMVLGTRIGILRTIPLMLDLFRGLNFQLIIKNQTAQFLVIKYVPWYIAIGLRSYTCSPTSLIF